MYGTCRSLQFALTYDCQRTFFKNGRDKIMSVHTFSRYCHKQAALRCLSAVCRDALYDTRFLFFTSMVNAAACLCNLFQGHIFHKDTSSFLCLLRVICQILRSVFRRDPQNPYQVPVLPEAEGLSVSYQAVYSLPDSTSFHPLPS